MTTKQELKDEIARLRLEANYWRGYAEAVRERVAELQRERQFQTIPPNPTWPTLPGEAWRITCSIGGSPEETR